MGQRYSIMDDKGVIWSSDAPNAHDEGVDIMTAVDAGKTKIYEPVLDKSWEGDLVFVQELSRTR